MKVYINGTFFDKEDAKISVFDHALLYGDGVFEGIRLYSGNVFRLEEHLERLEYSAHAILLELPWSRKEIADAVCETCRVNGLSDGYVRLIVTRGKGALGLSPRSCSDPQLIIIAGQIQLYPQEYYEKGLKLITSSTRRTNVAAFPPMVKSLNYLNNVMAKIDALNLGYPEAIMLNDQGYVAECTGDNIFIVQKGKLYTPPVSAGSLTGITREAVLDCAKRLGLEVIEANLTRYDIWIAKECFVTGSAAEVVPVVEVDARRVGDGKPGPITRQLLDEFHRLVTVEGARI